MAEAPDPFGRVRFAMRIRRQQRHLLLDVGAESFVSDALRIGDSTRCPASRGEPSGRSEMATRATAFRSFPELDVRLKFHRVTARRHIDRERHGAGRREVVFTKSGSIRTGPELERRRIVRRQQCAQRHVRKNRSGGATTTATGCRRRCCCAVCRAWRTASVRHRSAGDDSRVAPDHDRRRTRRGVHISEGQIDLHRPRDDGRPASTSGTIPQRIRVVMRRRRFQRRIVERQRALVARTAGRIISGAKNQLGQVVSAL